MAFFTIVRHGQTPNNVAGIVQSRTHGELTAKGVLMAKALGRYLESEVFTHIFSSDLKRCCDTTENIVGNLKTTVPPIHFTPTLRERDYGDWEFQPNALVVAKRNEMGLPPYHHHRVQVPNGESYEDCKKRAGKFFSEILQVVDKVDQDGAENDETAKANILTVTHGSLIACLLEYFLENPAVFELVNFDSNTIRKKHAENTSWTRIFVKRIAKDEGSKIKLTFTHFFDTEHLKSL